MPRKRKAQKEDPGPARQVIPDDPIGIPEQPEVEKEPDTEEGKLCKEIRDDYRHFLDYWRENREEMETDMRFAGGQAFSPAEVAFRAGLNRPCETPDELSQYVKQTNNNLRQNKRDSKISPSSEDATGEDAEKREAVLRGLSHRGNFQACLQTAFEGCTWSGFGFFGIVLREVDRKEKHLEPRPRRFANQFAVLLDPYAKEADYSDQKKAFVIDRMRQSDFGREYPNAKKRSFSADDAKLTGPEWIQKDTIVVAEYWRVEDDGKVCQYITNGLEILDKIPWVGSWIPIIPILGEEIYVTESGQIKRKYLSLIRRARTPQKMLAFIASQELEEFGQAPRAPFIGYKGQFTSPDWATINTNPKPYIEVEAMPDPLNPEKVLPLPTRPQYTPNAQAYEMAREAWRRGVQSAIGVMPLPTAAQQRTEKSGIALERIQNQESTGSYHFVDNADRALVNYGRQMNELISKGMTPHRVVGTRDRDESHGIVYLTTEEKGVPDGMSEENILFVDRGEYDLTVTTGPSKESQREDAADFVDTLIAALPTMGLAPPIAMKIYAIAIKLKNVGPLGDEIAKLLDPEEGDPMQQAQKLMAQAAQQQQMLTEAQAELQQLRLEKQGKVIEMQAKQQMHGLDIALEKAKLDNARAIAEIQTKAQILSERQNQLHEVDLELHSDAHELGLQKDQQAHEAAQAASAQAAAAAQPAIEAAANPPQPEVQPGA